MSVSVSGGPGSCRGIRTRRGLVRAELAGERADHRHVHAHGCRRRRPPAAAAGSGEVATVGGDHVRIQIGNDWRPPSCAPSQSPKERKIAPYCRRVLAEAARAAIRCASANRLRSSRPGVGGGEGERTATSSDASASSPSTSSSASARARQRERELRVAHRRGLFAKPFMWGHVKPRLRRQEPLESVGPQDPITEFSDPTSCALCLIRAPVGMVLHVLSRRPIDAPER